MGARGWSRWLMLGLLLTIALGLGLCCVRREPETAEPAASSAGEEDELAQREAAPTRVREPDAAPPIQEAAEPQPATIDEESDGSPLNPVAQFMRHSDPHDRDFLATVERETKKSPSPEVMELLALRRSGAARNELERFIDTELAGDVRVRAAARRWLRESNDGAAPPVSPKPGQGGGERSIQPMAPH